MDTVRMEMMEVDPYTSPPIQYPSCNHVDELKNENTLKSYKLLHAFYASCIKKNSFREKSKIECFQPGCQTSRSRVHACLSCVFFGCFNGHIQIHAATTKSHLLAIDTDSGEVYCAVCNDYKYDSDFMKIAREQNLIASSQRSLITGMPYKWEPSPEEIYLLQRHDIVHNSVTGVRGLVNGKNAICYLNCIIQCLIHAPIFRDYLLSMEHKCKNAKEKRPNCFICEMTNILQESFSGKKRPLIVAELLCLLYKRASVFGKRELHDAHEVFCYLLDNFHEDETETKEYSLSPCECIIHSIFELRCKKKGRCNSKHNAHDLKEEDEEEEEERKLDIILYELPKSCQGAVPFHDCLRRSFSDQCSKCQENVGCTIKKIPKKLPYIMNFCIAPSNNNNAFMAYEEVLDMSPYVTHPYDPDSTLHYNPDSTDNIKNQYYLFAIVEYIDGGDGGHYICYIKKHNQWFECNDAEIIPFDNKNITNINPRILFYHKTCI